MDFKQKYTFSERLKESSYLLNKYTDKIPIIFTKYNKKQKVNIQRQKFLVNKEITFGDFHCIVRKYVDNLSESDGLFLFIDNTIPINTDHLYTLYDQKKESDGFLYILYGIESTFG